MVDPTGVPASNDISIPDIAHTTDETAENIVTLLKFFNMLIAESAGNITSADIRRDPTRFIAKTMITAIMMAIIRLYVSALVPADLEKSSSNVTAKILL